MHTQLVTIILSLMPLFPYQNYPALYDAFNLVLNASYQFPKIEEFLEIKARDIVDKNFCPTTKAHDYGMELLRIARGVIAFACLILALPYLNCSVLNI